MGPRPLPLHLLSQAATLLSSLLVLSSLKHGSGASKNLLPDSLPEKARLALANHLSLVNPEDFGLFTKAVAAEATARHCRFIDGVVAYRQHPFKPHIPDYPVVWSKGTTRLLDCRITNQDLPPVLIIPSLINRASILDLTPRNSVIRGLAKRGVAPFLLDWGVPGEIEKSFSLTDYIVDRIDPALATLQRLTHRPAALLGYCMGGVLALAEALRTTIPVSGLVLMATPWDFHQGSEAPRAWLRPLWPQIRQLIMAQGQMSVDLLQTMFATYDLDLVTRKFMAFGLMTPQSGAAKQFVALEDWVNNGVPLVENVAIECLDNWYLDNGPVRGQWLVAGQPVRPDTLSCPSLLIVPVRDKIVAPASSIALACALPQAKVLRVAGGHVGMLLSRRVGSELHSPLARQIRLWAGEGEKVHNNVTQNKSTMLLKNNGI
jgi:polyhydroxyalkanoate synthase subunit PhaC